MQGERSLMTNAVRALIGSEAPSRQFVVDRLVAQRLAEALGEDPSAVAAAAYAPPYYISAFETAIVPTGIPGELESGVLASDEWEQWRPLRWNERITSTGRVGDVYERFGGRHGQTLYLRYEWTFTDAGGEVVAIARRIMARYVTVGAGEDSEEAP